VPGSALCAHHLANNEGKTVDRLRAEVAELRGLLQEVVDDIQCDIVDVDDDWIERARKALEVERG
jgi:hypothetical protein